LTHCRFIIEVKGNQMDYKHVEETLEKGEQELPAPYGKAWLWKNCGQADGQSL